MRELRNYIDTIRKLPLEEEAKSGILDGTALALLKLLVLCSGSQFAHL